MSKQNTSQRYSDKPKVSFGKDTRDPFRPYYILMQTDDQKEYMRFSGDEVRHFVRKGWGFK